MPLMFSVGVRMRRGTVTKVTFMTLLHQGLRGPAERGPRPAVRTVGSRTDAGPWGPPEPLRAGL